MTRGTRGRDPGQAPEGRGSARGGRYDDGNPYPDSGAYATAGYPQPGARSGNRRHAPAEGYPPAGGYPEPDDYPSGQYLAEDYPSGQYADDSYGSGSHAAGGRYPAAGSHGAASGYSQDVYPDEDGYGPAGYAEEGHQPGRGRGGREDHSRGSRYRQPAEYPADDGYDQQSGYPADFAEDYPSETYPAADYPSAPQSRRRRGSGSGSGQYQRSGHPYDDDAGDEAYDDPAGDWDDADGGSGRDRSGGRRAGVSGNSGFIPGLDDEDGEPRRKRKRKVGRVLAPLLAVVMLAGLGAVAYKFYPKFNTADYPGEGTGQVTVKVPPGATATSLAPELVQLGVVASTRAFVDAAKSSKNPTGLEPGYFLVHKHMKATLAYALLLNPQSRDQVVVTIPEGWRMNQTVALLQQKAGKGLPATAYQDAAKDTAALGLPSYAGGNPEGYLFPAQYDITPGETPAQVLAAMVGRFNQEAQNVNLTAQAQTGKTTPQAIITLASILEAEVGPQYYAQAAEVLYNRLNQGIPLGVDSTENYVLNRFGVSLSQSQLNVNSPYNTFLHKGLPPGPIDSPGDAAIQAALHPAHGNLLYFVTVNLKTGLTLFATNQADFNKDVAICNANKAC